MEGYGWRAVIGGLWLEGCGWRAAVGGLRLEGCGWRSAVGGLRLEGSGWSAVIGGLRLEGCRGRDAFTRPSGRLYLSGNTVLSPTPRPMQREDRLHMRELLLKKEA